MEQKENQMKILSMKKLFKKKAKLISITFDNNCTYQYACPDCKQDVTEYIDVCPNCGRKLSYERPFQNIQLNYKGRKYN